MSLFQMANSISWIREKLEMLSSDSDVDSDNEPVETLSWDGQQEEEKEETLCRICFGKKKEIHVVLFPASFFKNLIHPRKG